jgi:hypothetical protein
MSHLNIYMTSYGQKKGRESNWQFDSRPLKVRNRPDSGMFRKSLTHHWKSLDQSYTLLQTSSQSEVWAGSYELPKSRESKPGQFRNSFLGVLGQKPFGCSLCGQTQRILYGGRWWLPLSLGRSESSESVLPVSCPNAKSDQEGILTNLWLVLTQDRVAN